MTSTCVHIHMRQSWYLHLCWSPSGGFAGITSEFIQVVIFKIIDESPTHRVSDAYRQFYVLKSISTFYICIAVFAIIKSKIRVRLVGCPAQKPGNPSTILSHWLKMGCGVIDLTPFCSRILKVCAVAQARQLAAARMSNDIELRLVRKEMKIGQ